MKHIVMLSGGVSSAVMLHRVVERHGAEHTVALFADTLRETPGTYQLIQQVTAQTKVRLAWLRDPAGRDIWGIFFFKKMMGNSRLDPCSMYLKRIPMRKWLEKHYAADAVTVHIGFDADEEHRADRARPLWEPYTVAFPLADKRYGKPTFGRWLTEEFLGYGYELPELYQLGGFSHNNCSGFCVKAGFAQFRRLLETNRPLYLEHEANERRFNEEIRIARGLEPVSILRRIRDGRLQRVTMHELREEIDAGRHEQPSLLDLMNDSALSEEEFGACSCMEEPSPQEQSGRSS